MKVSIYTRTGITAATTYYRLMQYLIKIPCRIKHRTMIDDKLYNRVMPISKKSLPIKTIIFFYTYIRVLTQLIRDLFRKPDYLIVSRRFVSRYFPYSFRGIIKILKWGGTKIIWDFDDDILAYKEISYSGFKFLSYVSEYIIVASQYNKEIIALKFQSKVIILPTTDGDMYNLVTDTIRKKRSELLSKEIRLIWVGTFSSLKYVEAILPFIEQFAYKTKETIGKKVIFTIVCNKSLEYKSINFELRNILWKRDIAITEMLNSHIGLMPLPVNQSVKGKGGFKLIQYLSIGLPIVGTSIGINESIINKEVGIAINTLVSKEWSKALESITKSNIIWEHYSNKAFNWWTINYNYNYNLKKWKDILSGCLLLISVTFFSY